MPPTSTFAARVGGALGRHVVGSSRLTGGDVAEAFRIDFADGGSVFAKTHAAPPADFFRTEATGLEWLGDAGRTVGASGISVPDVLAVSDDLLVLDWIDEGRSSTSTDAELGRGLARIHRLGTATFGRPDAMTTGSRALPNDPCATWSDFYARNRLLPLAALAHDGGSLASDSVQRLELVADRLGEFGASDEPAALLHGDLWAGNRLVDDDGGNWLIDPAAHGGHREFDLAMMRLFGGFGPDCFRAYDDEYPLADGWSERVPLHQLAPLVVHAIKFGGAYPAAVERALDACLATT